MIATEVSISGIPQDELEYMEYLNRHYAMVYDFLKIKDGSVNAEKLRLFFEKMTSPFVYWKQNRTTGEVVQSATGEPQHAKADDGPVELSEAKRKELLDKLTEKYGLVRKGSSYETTKYLKEGNFNVLRDAMKVAGFHYDSKIRAFVPKEGENKR